MRLKHIEERQQLAELYQQSDELNQEWKAAMAPLEEKRKARWEEILAEHRASGGKWPDNDLATGDRLGEKLRPETEAEQKMGATYDARFDAVHAEIKALEAKVGEVCENYWTGEGRAICALTGLAILESDRVGIVIADALPVSAHIRKQPAEPSE